MKSDLNYMYYPESQTFHQSCENIPVSRLGWSGGAMAPGKLPMPTNLDYRSARTYCACSRCGRGCFDIISLFCQFSFLSPSLWETARYRLKYCLKGPLSPKQPTNQPFPIMSACQRYGFKAYRSPGGSVG